MADDTQIPLPTACMHGVGDFLGEERAAIAQAIAVSARRAALAQEAVRLHAQIGAVAVAGDAALAEALRQLFGLASQERSQTPGALVAWSDVEPVVLAALETITAFREAALPVVDAMAQAIKHTAALLATTDEEIELRATALLAGRNAALAQGAARFPIQ